MLAIDTSGSMAATDVAPTRLAAAQAAAKQFVAKLPSGLKIGLVAFGFERDAARLADARPRRRVRRRSTHLTVGGRHRDRHRRSMQSLDAIKALPPDANGKKPAAAIVLMSDGTPTIGMNGESPASNRRRTRSQAALDAKVPVNTIAFGTADGTVRVGGETVPVPADPQAMARDRVGHQRQVVHGQDREPAELGVRTDPTQRRLRLAPARHHGAVHGTRPVRGRPGGGRGAVLDAADPLIRDHLTVQ